MKIEKKNGEFILTTEDPEDNSPEREFFDFMTGVVNQVKKDMRKDRHLWAVEYYCGDGSGDDSGWEPSVFTYRTREGARKEARKEQIRPTRVRKYTRSSKG